VADHVARGVGLEDDVGELRVVGGAGARVEDLEPVAHGHHDVAAVAGGVQPGELLGVEVGDGVEGRPVEDEDAAFVGDGDPGACRVGVGRGGAAGGCARGAGGQGGGQPEGGGGEADSAEVGCAHRWFLRVWWVVVGPHGESPVAMRSVLTRIMVR
jgi:hypothetical protein